MTVQYFLETVCLTIAVSGSIYAVLCVFTGAMFRARMRGRASVKYFPPVTVLKPLYGADKHLTDNLRAACSMDYPDYQVVLSVQRLNDPAIPVMQRVQQEFGEGRVSLVIGDSEARANGKIQNLEIAFAHARHDVIVISDSDIKVGPDYLKAIVGPMADEKVGCVSTPYRVINAHRWYEKLELLTMNADFVPNLILASTARLTAFGLGASMCFRRKDLEAVGGFGAFREVLAEDARIALAIEKLGRRVLVAPYFVDMEVELKSFSDWWGHDLYWDQNTRVVRRAGFIGTIIIRAIPFALFYALLRGFDSLGLEVLAGAIAVRLVTAGILLWGLLGDREGLAALWLLPLRDLFGLVFWALALLKRDFIRRGERFGLLADGRIVPKTAR